MGETDRKDEMEVDIWRDTFVRYFGYANEVGESFRPILPRFVVPSYLISTAYVLGDTFDKSTKASKEPSSTNSQIAVAAADTLLWQGLASVIIPGFTINRVVFGVSTVLKKTTKNPALLRWAPTALGLAVIPLIIHPIDNLVDFGMDNTLRVWTKKLLDEQEK